MSILFDLDGTLVDTAPDFVQAINVLRAEDGKPELAPQALRLVRIATSHSLPALVEAGFDVKYDHPDSQALQKRLLESYQKHLGVYAKPFPGVLALLDNLEERNIPWGVVTNKHHFLTEPLLERLQLKNRAACIVSGDTTAHFKPHPEPLLHACKQIKLSPNNCIYIGDAERDIIAGKAAGMTTIGALFGYIEDVESAKQWEAHHYIHHVDEILPWYKIWLQTSR